MPIKKLTMLLVILIISINSYSQDYFIVNKDTTFCSNLNFKTSGQGYLRFISYTNENGKEIIISKRKKVPDITTLHIDDTTRDRIPQKANKPNSYIRYTKRVVDGKLKVYLYEPYDGHAGIRMGMPNPKTYDPKNYPSTGIDQKVQGVYRFFLKMPDGTYYKINSKKNRTKYIIPYLNKCEDFKNEYKGNFSPGEPQFMETIELYNSLCD
jgi:hypothetical protein